MLSPPLYTSSPELYICTPARWHVYAGKVRKKINNLERTLTEKCAQEVNGLMEEEERIHFWIFQFASNHFPAAASWTFLWPLAEVCWVWEFGHQHDLAHTERTFSRRLCVWKDSKFNITSFTREEIDSRWVGFHGHIGYYYLTIVCLSFSGLSYFGRPVWLAPQQRRAWVCNASCM